MTNAKRNEIYRRSFFGASADDERTRIRQCTGGQHRSVYSAEHIARYIHEKYGVKVILKHRELGIEEEL